MKKLLLIMLCIVLLVGSVYALEISTWDNVLNYKEDDMKVDVINVLGFEKLGTIELKSHSFVDEVLEFGFGQEEVVIYYDFTDWELYEDGLGEVYFTNMSNGEEIEKDYYFVEWVFKDVEVNDYKKVCELILNGTNVCESVLVGTHLEKEWGWRRLENKDIENKRIGLKTYVGQGDYIDAFWTIAGKKIKRHAVWTTNLNVDLISYYKLDETTGSNAEDSHGDNNGTLQNMENGDWVTGKINNALDFGGTNERILVPNSATLNTLGEGSLTVCTWMNTTEKSASRDMLGKGIGGGPYTFELYGPVATSGHAKFAIYDGSNIPNIEGTTDVGDGDWHFVCGVRDVVADKIRLYVDGVQDAIAVDDTTNADISGTADVEIGSFQGVSYWIGIMDEVMIWKRALTSYEINYTWNNEDGISYGVIQLSVVLNSPEDYYNSTSQTMIFNASVITPISELSVENVTLYINGIANETNSSGFNGTYIFTKTLNDGDHNWTIEAWDNNSQSTTATTRSFSVDVNNPSLVLLAPPTIVDFHSINTNLSLNWSANDTHIDRCWYEYAGINTTVTCSDNSTNINITNIINRTIIFYVNDTFGHMNFTSRSWNYTIFENSQTFNDETLEGTIETFTANITIGESSSIAIASLVYNGSSYIGSFSESGNNSILTINFTIPTVGTETNITFYWSLQLSDTQIINLTSHNQTIVSITLDNCSTNTVVLYNYTVVDEGNQSRLTNTTTELSINLLDVERENYIYNFSYKYLDINSFAVCISENIVTSTFVIDSIVKYEAIDYSVEYYNIVNSVITNSTIPVEITLYDLFSNDATEFKITFKAEDFTFVENALIYIDRQYIAENNSFKTVELPKTDSNGQTIGHFVRNDIIYNIRVIKDGVVLGNFENQIAFCEDYSIGNCQMILEATPEDALTFDYDEQLGIIFQSIPTYNEDTNIVSFSFSTDDGTIKTVFMDVTRDDIFGNRTICNNTLTSSSGTLSCSVPDIDDSVLRVNVYVDSQPVVFSSVTLEASDYGNMGYVIWFLLTFFFILIFADSKTGVLMGIAVSFIGAIALGITRGNIIGIGSAGIWVLVIVILGIVKLNKEKPQ